MLHIPYNNIPKALHVGNRMYTVGNNQTDAALHNLKNELLSHLTESKQLLYELKGMIAANAQVSGKPIETTGQKFGRIFIEAALVGAGSALAGIIINILFKKS